jgi:hypothetical protein
MRLCWSWAAFEKTCGQRRKCRRIAAQFHCKFLPDSGLRRTFIARKMRFVNTYAMNSQIVELDRIERRFLHLLLDDADLKFNLIY